MSKIEAGGQESSRREPLHPYARPSYGTSEIGCGRKFWMLCGATAVVWLVAETAGRGIFLLAGISGKPDIEPTSPNDRL